MRTGVHMQLSRMIHSHTFHLACHQLSVEITFLFLGAEFSVRQSETVLTCTISVTCHGEPFRAAFEKARLLCTAAAQGSGMSFFNLDFKRLSTHSLARLAAICLWGDQISAVIMGNNRCEDFFRNETGSTPARSCSPFGEKAFCPIVPLVEPPVAAMDGVRAPALYCVPCCFHVLHPHAPPPSRVTQIVTAPRGDDGPLARGPRHSRWRNVPPCQTVGI